MEKVAFNISFIYDIDTTPDILEDSGIGVAFYDKMSLEIVFTPIL